MFLGQESGKLISELIALIEEGAGEGVEAKERMQQRRVNNSVLCGLVSSSLMHFHSRHFTVNSTPKTPI